MAAVGASPRRVCGILFDFDNTLVPSREADMYAIGKVKEKLMAYLWPERAEAIAKNFQSFVAQTPVDPTGTVGPHQWRVKLWEKALVDNGNSLISKKPQAAEMYELWRSSRLQKMAFTEEIRNLISDLQKKYKIAIVTNSDPVIQKQKLAACRAEKFFEKIIISGEQPHAKPHSSIFLTACNLISVAPGNCIMVGDSLQHDIQGGKNAGLLASVWIQLEGTTRTEDHPKPDFIIASVLELPKILYELELCC